MLKLLLLVLILVNLNGIESKGKFQINILKQHNRIRKLAGLPEMVTNKELVFKAFQIAKQMAESKSLSVEKRFFMNDALGQNVGRVPITGKRLEALPLIKVLNEDPRARSQILNLNSRQIGFGKANDGNGNVYFVGLYYPAGPAVGLVDRLGSALPPTSKSEQPSVPTTTSEEETDGPDQEISTPVKSMPTVTVVPTPVRPVPVVTVPVPVETTVATPVVEQGGEGETEGEGGETEATTPATATSSNEGTTEDSTETADDTEEK